MNRNTKRLKPQPNGCVSFRERIEDIQASWDRTDETFQALLKQAVTTERERIKVMGTPMNTIRRYAQEAVDSPDMRDTALRMIIHLADEALGEPQLTEAEAQPVLGAMPLRGLPVRCVHNNTPESGCDWCRIYAESNPAYDKDDEDECAFIHVLPSGSMRCGALREHHSQYTGHEFTEPQPAPSDGELIAMEPLESDGSSKCSHSDKEWTLSIVNPADVKCDYDYIASASTHKHAIQIVRDHQLAALVPGLVENLREVAIRSLRYCEEKYGHDDQARLNLEATLEIVEATITTASKEQK